MKVLIFIVLLVVAFYCWKNYNKDTMNIVNGSKNIGIHLLKDGVKQINKLEENIDTTEPEKNSTNQHKHRK
jgi:hypothetical protein